MNLLLDTHVLLWMAQEPSKISIIAGEHINSKNSLFLSYVSIWEIAIKTGIQKIKLDYSVPEFIDLAVSKHSLQMLPIAPDHIYYLNQLPLHHRDPFDRLLIAQSLVQNLSIVSSDIAFDSYDVKRIW